MSLKIYNTMTRKKEAFEPIEPGKIKIYVCGVTVYDLCHMGHARALVNFDVIVRYMRFLGYDVTYVRNFTDIDDKIINRARERGISCQALAEENIEAFRKDTEALGIMPADIEPLATHHIDDMVELVQALEKRGNAYNVGGDVYFRVRSFKEYGKLSGRNIDDLEAGARIEVDAKKEDPLDFTLWKSSKPLEPSWPSPWGEGRPGWHIECSAMSAKYLGQPFDIHGGGKDLIFPHHENEIAQSEAGRGVEFARYWMHNGHITVNKDKMAKSLKNFVTIRDALEKHDPQAIRYFLLSTHYRAPLDYSDQGLLEAGKRVESVYETLARIGGILKRAGQVHTEGELAKPEVSGELLNNFTESMDDDFNTAAALGRLSVPLRLANEIADKPKAFGKPVAYRTLMRLHKDLTAIADVLGIFDMEPSIYLNRIRDRRAAEKGINPAEVERLLVERTEARQNKLWDRADEIRNRLKEMGIDIMDTVDGSSWKVLY
ncbi:MAG: cysteine--tRNA ligase [Deltaproteobacteria bacterium]|nr:cysteine--tRNA ligase [Deltaproteobacteria bacterium]